MRGLEDALARIARRDELRERALGGSGAAHRAEPPPPSVSPVVDEVTEALQNVVRRNPGVFATVVVQEADTAWSVWIGEWDGTLRTRVTRLEADPPPAAEHQSEAIAPIAPIAPGSAAARPAGPAMNDRVAGRIADLLRRENTRESSGVDA